MRSEAFLPVFANHVVIVGVAEYLVIKGTSDRWLDNYVAARPDVGRLIAFSDYPGLEY